MQGMQPAHPYALVVHTPGNRFLGTQLPHHDLHGPGVTGSGAHFCWYVVSLRSHFSSDQRGRFGWHLACSFSSLASHRFAGETSVQ